VLADVMAPSNASSLRFVLVDDTATFRELLKEALQRRFRPKELHDFADGRAALEHCLADPPDLLIVDLYLRGMDGRDIVGELRRRQLTTRVVVLTAHPEAQLPAELVALGVAGFVDKNSPLEQIDRAVQCVLEGGMFFSATVPPPLPALAAEPALPRLGADALSEREREVVRLVARGLVSKEVAAQLGLSARTVEKHRARIFAKLGLHDVPTLVRWCLRNGLG
jgi:DNA-binding NarL/FixJ family response regulator